MCYKDYKRVTENTINKIDKISQESHRPIWRIQTEIDIWRDEISEILKQSVEIIVDDKLIDIGRCIISQDNRLTAHPVFVVEEQDLVGPIEEGYHYDIVEWFNDNGYNELASETRARRLEALDRDGREYRDWKKFRSVVVWRFKIACFTEKGCENYLRINGHNLKKSRIYVYGSFRNDEWNTIRQFLIDQHEKKKSIE